MSSTTIPILLAGLALIAGFAAQRGIRQGLSRFYALEREAVLRRANYMVLASLLLFAASVAWLVYNQREMVLADEAAAEAALEATATAQVVLNVVTPSAENGEVVVEKFPPPIPATPTEDPNRPTETPIPVLRRGVIAQTGGSGAYLRTAPSLDAPEVEVLYDGEIVILNDDLEPVQANGFTWISVRTIANDQGWVADSYLEVRER